MVQKSYFVKITHSFHIRFTTCIWQDEHLTLRTSSTLRRSKRGHFVSMKTHPFNLQRTRNIWGSVLLWGSQAPFPLTATPCKQYCPFQQRSLATGPSKPQAHLHACLFLWTTPSLTSSSPQSSPTRVGVPHATSTGRHQECYTGPLSPVASGLFEGYVMLLWLLLKHFQHRSFYSI